MLTSIELSRTRGIGLLDLRELWWSATLDSVVRDMIIFDTEFFEKPEDSLRLRVLQKRLAMYFNPRRQMVNKHRGDVTLEFPAFESPSARRLQV